MAINLEVVNFQPNAEFFKGLTLAVKQLRQDKDFTPTSDHAVSIAKIIYQNTGIKVALYFDGSKEPNAWVHVPDIKKDHPFILEMWAPFTNHTDAHLMMQIQKKKRLSGTVDLKRGRLGGSFSDFEVRMAITHGLLRSTRFKDEEIAAILLHECGHVLTYFEFLVSSIRTNIILGAVAENVVKEPNEQRRIEILDATSKHFNWEMEDPADLVKAKNGETVYIVLLEKHREKMRNELGADIYDLRTFESISDQYAVRMGAGRALATGLDKLYHNDMSKRSTAFFLFIEVVKLLAILLMAYYGPIRLIFVMIAYDPTYRIYDRPGERLDRIRKQLIEASKNRQLTGIQKHQLKADIEMVEMLLKEYNDRRTFYEFAYTTFLPKARDQNNRILYQQQLEDLASNELFVRSMTLSTMTS